MRVNTKLILFIFFVCLISTFIFGYTLGDNNSKDFDTYTKIEPEIIKAEASTASTEEYVDVWTIENANIKIEPKSNSETVGTYCWNTKVSVAYINNNWAKIKGSDYYIDRLQVSEYGNSFVDYDVPVNNTIKSYMDYRYITSKTSDQYKLQESLAYTGDYGLRMVNGRYCIALGSYYTTTIGQYVDIELENGSVIHCILADCKADIHTDSTNRINPNGSVLEFVVDTDSLDDTARIMGDISCVDNWDSKVVNVRVYDKVENFK